MSTKISVQKLQQHLNKCLDFLAPHQALLNDHMIFYFTNDLWNKHIPSVIKQEISLNSNVEIALNTFWTHLDPNKLYDDKKVLPNFRKFLVNARSHSIDNLDDVWISVDKLKKILPYKEQEELKLHGFMNEKKNHEVTNKPRNIEFYKFYLCAIFSFQIKIIANVIHSICSQKEPKMFVVDAGGGKGNLASCLVLEHNIKTLGIDWDAQLAANAINNFGKLKKNWNSMKKEGERRQEKPTEKFGGPKKRQIPNKTITENPMFSENYQTKTHFITNETNFLDLIHEKFNVSDSNISGICLSGLHTCGDLSPTCIRKFATSDHVTALCNVGCCYHLLTEQFSNNADNEIVSAENFGFPMSKFLIDKKVVIGRNARMTACQALPRVVSQRQVPHNHLFYRALLEVLIKDNFPELHNKIEVGRLKACTTFAEYVRKSSKKCPSLNFNNFTDDELNDFYFKYSENKNLLHLYYLIRQSIASIVETVILFDRILYLKEFEIWNKIEINSYLVKFFDDVISPRCYGIVTF